MEGVELLVIVTFHKTPNLLKQWIGMRQMTLALHNCGYLRLRQTTASSVS